MPGKPGAGATLALLAVIAAATSAAAQTPLPEIGPMPYGRPSGTAAAAAARAIDTLTTTGSVATPEVNPVEAAELTALRKALDALSAGDVAEARRARDAMPKGSLDRRIVMWAIAVSGAGAVPSGEIAHAAHALSGWPGMATLRDNSERAMLRENPGPRLVLDAFGNTRAQTAAGVTLLARANLAIGETAKARRVLSAFWRTEKLNARDEAAIIREFGSVLSKADHRHRMERMLYADRLTSAMRVAKLAGAEKLAAAFSAVTRNRENADELLAAVPETQRGAAYIFAKSRYLRRSGDYRKAAAVMRTAPRDAASLVDPDAWWIERRVLSRELLDLDDPKAAYEIAAAHAAESPVYAADAEFHAGWYALRGVGEAGKAAGHFARILDIAEGPISLARAHYWLGRAMEAGAPGEPRVHFEKAAEHGATFYGQLAAARLGRERIAAKPPQPTDADRLAFERREAVRAIRRLEAAGHSGRAYTLYKALAEELDSVGELVLLADMAEKRNDHFLALRVGKWAAGRGLEVGSLAHPLGAIPAAADISGAGKALAYAIARQESEFNVDARSGAGALGLLQLLPGTARDMARKAGIAYSAGKLTTDAGYNATLGSHYLDEQLSRFDGSYILTFIGYNAGPSRAREWIERYGDPRGKPIDEVVDWIERIPYTETRAYVQRVMENYQVYKMRLTGRMDIVGDLVDGR